MPRRRRQSGGELSRRFPAWPWIRDGILFAIGVIGIIYETAFVDGTRWGLLAIFAGCLGVPFALRRDNW